MASNKDKPSFTGKVRSWWRKHVHGSRVSLPPEAAHSYRTKSPIPSQDPDPDPDPKSTTSEAENHLRQSAINDTATPSAADGEAQVKAEVGAHDALSAALPADTQPFTITLAPSAPTTRPTAPRNLSQEAFDALPHDIQDQIKKLIPTADVVGHEISVSNEIDALVDIVKAKQDECAAKFWKIKVFDHDIVIKDLVKGALTILKGVGDVAIQFAPAPGSAVWSGVKTLMEMYDTGEAEICALLTVAQVIIPILYRVQAYEVIYTKQSIATRDLELLRSASINVYNTCFELIANTSKELDSKLRRARHAILKPGAISEMLQRLKSQEREHTSAVNLCHQISTDKSSKFVQDALQKLQQSINANSLTLQKIEAGVDSLVTSDREKQLDWISDVKYTDDHNFHKKGRAKNTCAWLLEHGSFDAWLMAEEPARFWLHGDVGTGKSVLSSSVIDYLHQFCADSIEDGGFAFFYCDRQIPDRREASSILRSYVRQLSTTYRSQDHFRQELETACLDAKRKSGHLDAQECLKQIVSSVNLYPCTVLVLDGLDECSEADRTSLLNFVEDLFAQTTKPLKIYIASRPNVDIERQIEAVPFVETYNRSSTAKYADIKRRFDASQHAKIDGRLDVVQPFDVNTENTVNDIKTYVEEAIDGHKNWNDPESFQITSTTRSLIVKRLTDGTTSSGKKSPPMFRWAHLQLEQIFDQKDEKDILSRLGQLPQGLNESYSEIYKNNTEKLGDVSKSRVDRAFLWMMCASRPLSKSFLLEVICISQRGDLDGEVKEKALLQLCQHLLVIDSSTWDPFWRFPHASVGEWLETQWSLADAHAFVAKVCLSQLLKLYDTFDPTTLPERDYAREKWTAIDIDKRKLTPLSYARYCWPLHVRALENEAFESLDTEMTGLLKKFLGSPMKSSVQYQRWLLHIKKAFHDGKFDRPLFEHQLTRLQPSDIAVFSMVFFSLTTPLLDWWKSADIDVSINNAEGETLLAISDSVRVSQLLLQRGANVNQLYSYGTEPFRPNRHVLVRAAGIYGEGLEMVKLLVNAGADVEATFPDQSDSNPLNAAVSRQDLDLVRYLVEEANANVFIDLPEDSILVEATHGAMGIVQYLVNVIKSRAKKPVDQLLASALSMSAFIGRVDMVKYFVEEVKVDPNTPLKEGKYGSVLASSSTLPVVEYLVTEAGVDVNARIQYGEYRYGSALALHAAFGHLAIVKYLVEEAHADINMPLEFGKQRNALEAAKSTKFVGEEVVRYLESRLSGIPADRLQSVSSSQPLDQVKGPHDQERFENFAGRKDRKFSTDAVDDVKKLVSRGTF
ncbi:MAG: hypothetical protein M1820_003979 [Bogoriella megaspora]|nr:MAG: hypothetical protein M1820_003979 [Bogoriella megaspora]